MAAKKNPSNKTTKEGSHATAGQPKPLAANSRAAVPKKAKPKRPSGPSGENQQPGRILRGSPEQFEKWDARCRRLNKPWSTWMRELADRDSEKK